MNFEYIGQALGYHGQPMQKIWDDERGVDDLRLMGLTQVNYSVYQERQKYLTFQERAKRLKMHQFLARKATDLYDRSLVANVMEDKVLAQGRFEYKPVTLDGYKNLIDSLTKIIGKYFLQARTVW